MSHFIVTVALKYGPADEVKDELNRVLDRFDENKEVEPYGAETVEEITSTELYLNWKAEMHPNLSQDEALKLWLGEDVQFDAEGRRITTYNPDSKWDWWVVGGRWEGYLTLKSGEKVDVAEVSELAPEAIPAPFAYVDTDGEWHEKGQMGWFGVARNEADDKIWTRRYLNWVSSLPKDTILVAVDCHI